MKRSLFVAALALLTVAPLLAQSPEGWKLRVDRSTNANDPDAAGEVQLTTIPGGFHAVTPSAAIFWHPNNTGTGAYTLRGTFKLMEPSGHTNYYGLFFGGQNLEGAEQNYFYFLVAQNGTWLLNHRQGDRMPDPNAPARGRGGRGRGGPQAIVETIVGRTEHAAVQQPGADGTSTNTLEVRVDAETATFAINGTTVHTMPRTDLRTDGIYGFRVNHQLNVQVTNFGTQ